MKIKLTQKHIDNPPPVPPGKAKVEHCDTALPGLLWEQRAINNEWGTFRLRYKNAAGRTAYAQVGRSCNITLKEARERVRQLKAEIQLGADPQAAAREKKRVPTWSVFFPDYLKYVKQHKRSWTSDEEMHRLRIAPKFGDVRLNKFTRHAVQQFHNELRDSGLAPATCDHHLKLIRQALNLAVEWDLLEKNPVAKVKLFNVDNRQERLMSDDELQRLMAVLATDRNQMVCSVIKFLLLSGCRVSEALNGRWDAVNREQHTFSIEATNSKSKQRRAVPLSDGAMAVLDQLGTEGKSEWLFTSSHGGGAQRLTTITKSWQRIRLAADLKHIRLHDLRHMAASAILNSGHSLYVVQKILGHSDPSVTQRYAHLSTATLQDAANSISTYLDKALEKTGE
jgi:integrase